MSNGLYRVREGDTPRSVAERVYGTGNKYAEVMRANPHPLSSGTLITIPNVDGRFGTWMEHDTPQSIIKRLYPNQPTHLYIFKFFSWNGGEDADIPVGSEVFIPER